MIDPTPQLPELDEIYQKAFSELRNSSISAEAFYEHTNSLEMECRERQLLQTISGLAAANLKLAEAEQCEQRLMDLVRHTRHELFGTGLIDGNEFAALVTDSEGGRRVARLEGYDALRRELAASPALCYRNAKTAITTLRSEYGMLIPRADAEQAIQRLLDSTKPDASKEGNDGTH